MLSSTITNLVLFGTKFRGEFATFLTVPIIYSFLNFNMQLLNFASIVIFSVILVLTCGQQVKKLQQERRTNENVKNMVSKVDDRTRRLVASMAANGMPKAAIADKIKYQAGGNKQTAQQMVDVMSAQQKGTKRGR